MDTAASWRLERAESGRLTLWFDRPGSSQNSLDQSTLEQLGSQLDAVESDVDAGWLVLRSAKPKGFCAGADLWQIAAFRTLEEVEAFGRLGLEVFARLARLRIPTVCVIHGACLGGGLELALSCGQIVAIAGPDPLKAGAPEIRLGLLPGWGGIGALFRRVGLRPALQLMLSGAWVDAAGAGRLGLADHVLDAGDVEAVLANRLTRWPPTAQPWPPTGWCEVLAEGREQIASSPSPEAAARLLDILEIDLTRGLEAAHRESARALAELVLTPHAQAAIAAFCTRGPGRG
jgi:enoyl-CoA hydratase/carnithine racemase